MYTSVMRRRLRDLLRLAGLREEETALYLLLLKKRRATASALIAESGLNVMTAYRTLRRLRERGLVSALQINQKQYVYAPLTLAALTKKLDTEQRKLRRLQLALQGLDALLPYVDAEEKNGDEELVEVREGLDAFREEYLKIPDLCTDEFLHIGSMQNYWELAGMSDEAPEELAFREKRFKRGIYARIFNTPSPVAEGFAARDSREMRTTRLLEDLPIKKDYMAFTATDVRHFICDEGNLRTVIIRHPELVALHRRMFSDLWDAGSGA